MAKKPVIFILGKSGSGKDTQADVLMQDLRLEVVNSGDILRRLGTKEALEQFSEGTIERYEVQEIQNIINKGKFVPTLSISCQWRFPLLELIRKPNKFDGVVFTGSPRKLAEAMILDDFFINWPDAADNFEIIPVELQISDEEAKKRLFARRQCKACRKVFSADEVASLKNCDTCSGEMIRRKDDTEEGIRSRMEEFKVFVVPVLDYFEKAGKLKRVNGEQAIGEVHRDVTKALGL